MWRGVAATGSPWCLTRYEDCIDGDEAIMNERMSEALRGAHDTLDGAPTEEDGAEPVAHPWHAEDETEGDTDETAGGGLA
jgi:hypothetical protein